MSDAFSRMRASMECRLHEAEGPGVALALAQERRRLAGKVDHGGHLPVAGARVDHAIEPVLEVPPDLRRVVERDAVVREDQRARQERLAPDIEERAHDRM